MTIPIVPAGSEDELTDCRVSLLEEADLVASEVAAYAQVRAARRRMPNLFKALAHSPGAMQSIGGVGAFFRAGGSLDRRIQEAVILTVANDLSCQYEWTHHRPVARELGLEIDSDTGDIDASSGFGIDPDLWRAMLGYSSAVARGVRVADEMAQTLIGSLGERDFVELTALAAYYGMLHKIILALEIPLEEGVSPISLPPQKAQ